MNPEIKNLKNCTVEIYDELESTQLFLKNRFNSNSHIKFHAILALNQTRGIGRLNNTWISFKGALTFSFPFSSSFINTSQERLLSVICNKLREKYSVKSFIKWPNDIFIGNAKICGIIIDAVNSISIAGIGINLTGKRDHFESVESLTGIVIDKLTFVDDVIGDFLSNKIIQTDSYSMPEFINYEGKLMKLHSINGLSITLGDQNGLEHTFFANGHCYDLKENAIKRK